MSERTAKIMGKTDSQKTEAQDIKREQILLGAEKLFTRYGYPKTTMDEIAEAAGLKKASIYYYYENKEAIFRDVVIREIDIFIIEAVKKTAHFKNPVDKITNFCFFRLDYFQQFINLHNLSIQILREAAPFFRKLQSEFLQKEIIFLKNIIDEGVRLKHFKKCDSGKIAALMLDISDAMKYKEFRKSDLQFISDVDYIKMKKEIKNILELIFEGLKYN